MRATHIDNSFHKVAVCMSGDLPPAGHTQPNSYLLINYCDHTFWVNVFSIGGLIKINECKISLCLFWQEVNSLHYT